MPAVPATTQSQTPPNPVPPASAPEHAPPARVQPTDEEWAAEITPKKRLQLDAKTLGILQEGYSKIQKLDVLLDNAAVVEKDDGSEHLEWLEEALKAAVEKTVYAAEKPPTAWEPNPAENFWNTAVLERLRKTERAAETIYKDLVNIVSKALALVEVAEKHHKKNAQKRQELRALLERVKSYRMSGLEVLDDEFRR
jgi:hypothetical protein